MMNYIKVKDHDGLVRDKNTGAILNINRTEIEAARERKALRQKKKQEEQELKQTVDHLQNEVSEIKDMLTKIVEKL
jgi:uncharacterized FlaG/YvyC family protein